jgi:hypothetical protein
MAVEEKAKPPEKIQRAVGADDLLSTKGKRSSFAVEPLRKERLLVEHVAVDREMAILLEPTLSQTLKAEMTFCLRAEPRGACQRSPQVPRQERRASADNADGYD